MKDLTSRSCKNLKPQGEKSLSDYRPGYALRITKKLNPLGYFAIGAIYTLAVIITTINVMKGQKTQRGLSYSEDKIKEEILAEIRSMKNKGNPQEMNRNLNNHLEHFRNDLIQEVNRINIKYVDMLERNKNSSFSAFNQRVPASVQNKQGKTMIYNQQNANVLRFRQNKEYKRLKEKFQQEKEKLVKALDLNNPGDQKRLKDFEDKVDITLYEMKQHHWMLRDKFREQQYIVTDSK